MNRMSSTETKPSAAAPAENDPLWYKDAIIYQLHVKAFADSNNDGIGDFTGLTEKLDYLQDLGVTTLWLMPFYPSPGRDDGYDIGDYGSVHPDFGTMKDFRRFIVEAKKRGLRVITELVINHTSDQHDWFKRARRSPKGSSARDWYVWSDTDQKYQGTRIIFTDTEKSNWSWDAEAKAYYWHRFFSHQPDLNFDNPRVVSAVIQVMKRWLDTGVDGFRLDAIPYLCERDGTNNENLPETHAIIKQLRAELDAYAPGKVLLAEANQWPEDVQEYFGQGDECQMAYHFPLMPRIYMAIAQEDRFPITDILRQTPDIPANCQWAMFLRNHDELTLEMVTDVERDYLWSTYANDPRARINVGIRRRLAPLMDNDRRKIELMNSLLLSFPGTPIIYYGDEIGMGDNIYLGDRNGVRTPMQWTPDRNGGFSRADPARLYAPPIMDSIYGYESVNVEAQSRSLSSQLSATKRLISVRKSTQAFGRGTMTFIRPENRSVLAYIRQYGDEVILCVANLSRSAQATELDLSAWKERVPLEMLGRTNFPTIGELPYMITLGPYGFYWFELRKPELSAHASTNVVPEFETLVVPVGATWMSLARTRGVFELDVLPTYLARTRWYPERSAKTIHPALISAVPFCDIGDNRPWLVFFETTQRGVATRYVLPMLIEWVRFDRERYNPRAFAAVHRRRNLRTHAHGRAGRPRPRGGRDLRHPRRRRQSHPAAGGAVLRRAGPRGRPPRPQAAHPALAARGRRPHPSADGPPRSPSPAAWRPAPSPPACRPSPASSTSRTCSSRPTAISAAGTASSPSASPARQPDIMHWTYPLPIRLEGARNIYTLHDLVPLRLPYTTLDNKRYYLRLLRGCLRWGDHICTVSESSRRDIIDLLGARPDQVTNTYQSIRINKPPAQTDTPEGLAAWLRGLFGLEPGRYFLFYGALEPKKNIGRLIEAYLSASLPIPLVIVGGRAWKSEGELRLTQPRPGEKPKRGGVGHDPATGLRAGSLARRPDPGGAGGGVPVVVRRVRFAGDRGDAGWHARAHLDRKQPAGGGGGRGAAG